MGQAQHGIRDVGVPGGPGSRRHSQPVVLVAKAYTEGSLVAVGANEPVVPASDLQDAMRRIKQLEAALGRKTLENDILKEAVDFAKAKKWIARSPLLPGDDR